MMSLRILRSGWWLSVEVTFGDDNHYYDDDDDNNIPVIKSGRRGMEVPRFPAPPPLRSISLDISGRPNNNWPTNESSSIQKRRARSASWLVARKSSQQTGQSGRRRVRPLLAARKQLAAELGLTSVRDKRQINEIPASAATVGTTGTLPSIREDRTPKARIKENEKNELDVICYATSEARDEKLEARLISRPRITDHFSSSRDEEDDSYSGRTSHNRRLSSGQKSIGMQTTNQVLYRLRMFPILKDIVDGEKTNRKSPIFFRFIRFLGRLALCQFGLTWLLTLWAILGAMAFYMTEGPRERQQVHELKSLERELAVGLATDLRQLRVEERETEPLWGSKIRQCLDKHEKILLLAVSSGYGEGGEGGRLWTFPGCVLFAISVLTTLGFGAPVPRTNAGRTVTVIFASIGIPAHFLLVLNIGLMLAVRLKRYGINRSYREECHDDPLLMDYMPMPMWVKVVPFLGMGAYYTLGIIGFGFARLRPVSDSLLFPLDFTAAGGLASIAGHVRVLYGLYLEGAVTLAAFAVAVLKVSATQSLTNIGLKYGLIIPA